MTRLSQSQQEQVFRLRKHGLSYREIAQLIGTSKSTVDRLLPKQEQQKSSATAGQQHESSSSPLEALLSRLKGLPFYSSIKEKCFWYEIGAPISNLTNGPLPLHEFQQDVISELETSKRLAILKARNLGLTELGLVNGNMDL